METTQRSYTIAQTLETVGENELVLVDAGCEVNGYASDITRTWPVSGKFTQSQRDIYELVLKANFQQ